VTGGKKAAGGISPAAFSFFVALLTLACLAAAPRPARAPPRSDVALRLSETGADVTVKALAIDLAHDLPGVEAGDLLSPGGAARQQNALAAILAKRLTLSSAGSGETFAARPVGIEPDGDGKNVRLQFRYNGKEPPRAALTIHCRLFPHDPRHKTYLDVYDRNGDLERHAIFDNTVETLDFKIGARQSTLSVVGQFLFEGVHHIFLGPDHILFVVGLLLLGGTLKQLLKIVSAFTLAHSVTLALATLNLLNPPARLIEPAIAASIVFVGVHSLLTNKHKRDWRLLFAFCFGFIHGFGFANALREMELPRAALVWSLFSFNAGVEVGQACIVLSVAPLLALLRARATPLVTRRVLLAGSLGVIGAGAFWFVQRVVAPG